MWMARWWTIVIPYGSLATDMPLVRQRSHLSVTFVRDMAKAADQLLAVFLDQGRVG